MGRGAFRQRGHGLSALGPGVSEQEPPEEDASRMPDASGPEEAAAQAYLEQVEQVRSFLSERKEFLYGEWVAAAQLSAGRQGAGT